MHPMIRFSLAALTAAAMLNGMVTAAAAEDYTPVEVQPVCPDYQPVSFDMVTVFGLPEEPLSVKLVQHSPERENLVLYDSSFPAGEASQYLFCAEPGDYTIYIAVNAVKDSAVQRVFQQDFTIENADYLTGEDACMSSDYRFTVSLRTVPADDPAVPAAGKSTAIVSDWIRQVDTPVNFGRYELQRGDFDGDGKITAADAQDTLQAYTAALAGSESDFPADHAQKAACDIDGDGTLSSADAQCILNYYTAALTGTEPLWGDEPEISEA